MVSDENPNNGDSDVPVEQAVSPSFALEIEAYIDSIETISSSCRQVIQSTVEELKREAKKVKKLVKEVGEQQINNDGEIVFKFKIEYANVVEISFDKLKAIKYTLETAPSIYFCALVHQYDAYIGRLLRTTYYAQPSFLNASEKKLSFCQLMSLESIDKAREYMVEQEVGSLLRESRITQLNWIDGKCKTNILKVLDSLSSFVELTERRNILVHCDGIVSSQYLNVCKEHGVVLDADIVCGATLTVPYNYFITSSRYLIEVGVKLGQMLWRKMIPSEQNVADEALHNIAFELLCRKRYKSVISILRFALKEYGPKASDEINKLHTINLALALSYSGNRDEALGIVNSQDWSASADRFRYAVSVIQRNWAEAASLMRKIGDDSNIPRFAYIRWPLFKEFREQPEFLTVYQDIYGNEFELADETLFEETGSHEQVDGS